MGTLAGAAEDGERQAGETLDASNTSSPSSSYKHIPDPVVYKLVRVEGDGRLVPATDDEIMEVDDQFEDDKGEVPSSADTVHVGGCMLNEEFSSVKANIDDSEGILLVENAKIDSEKLNARLEYIGVMLQKVKQEERLRLSSGSPDHSFDYMPVEVHCADPHAQFSVCDKNLQTGNSLQQFVPIVSPMHTASYTEELKTRESRLKATDGSVVSRSSASASCSSAMPDFSKIKGKICLDNRSVKELQETFNATFGRETTVKDKLWLKRRIAMGLTNSCEFSTTTFIIEDNKLVRNIAEEVHDTDESTKSVDYVSGAVGNNYEEPPVSPTNQMGDRHIVSGKRLRKPEGEEQSKSEDFNSEQSAIKRARKPTKRYIEELSEADSVRLVSSIKNSGQGQSAPHSCARSVCYVAPDGSGLLTRQLSLGGSGLNVPYVSRIRRGRPRENFMPLMKYHPSGIGMVANVVKKALGVCNPEQDSDGESMHMKARPAPQEMKQPVVAEVEKEKPDFIICKGEQQQAEELENLDSFGDNSDYDGTTMVPTSTGGTRRKHHRAWSLGEVIKLVEGVSRYGAGRWSEIKRVSFASFAHRTSVDLKDKWRNLLRASYAQAPRDRGMKNSRKHASMPIPASILFRVRELAERHAQSAVPDVSTCKFSVCGGKNVLETRLGYL